MAGELARGVVTVYAWTLGIGLAALLLAMLGWSLADTLLDWWQRRRHPR